jgi:hypothetical protein
MQRILFCQLMLFGSRFCGIEFECSSFFFLLSIDLDLGVGLV